MKYLVFDQRFYVPGELNVSEVVLENHFQLGQKMFYISNEVPLFDENLDLLQQKAGIFGLEWPGFMTDRRELLRLSKRLLNKNRFYRTGLFDFRLIWGRCGAHCLIQAMPSEEKTFLSEGRGLLMNFSEIPKFVATKFSSLDIFCQPFWDFARSELKDSQAGNSVILNTDGWICEAIGANIFFIRRKSLITPSRATGCYIDTIREKVLEAAIAVGYQVGEPDRISIEQVSGMDEAFIASEAGGMQWIIGIGPKRYIHSKADDLNRKLNEMLTGSVQ